MYAIVEIAGKQYKVEEKQELYVDKLSDVEVLRLTLRKYY